MKSLIFLLTIAFALTACNSENSDNSNRSYRNPETGKTNEEMWEDFNRKSELTFWQEKSREMINCDYFNLKVFKGHEDEESYFLCRDFTLSYATPKDIQAAEKKLEEMRALFVFVFERLKHPFRSKKDELVHQDFSELLGKEMMKIADLLQENDDVYDSLLGDFKILMAALECEFDDSTPGIREIICKPTRCHTPEELDALISRYGELKDRLDEKFEELTPDRRQLPAYQNVTEIVLSFMKIDVERAREEGQTNICVSTD